MVARSPPKLKKKMVAPLDPNQIRETVNKVEKCMARLQELQYVTGGTKVNSGVNFSPKSTRGYLRSSLRCKQESLRIRNANGQRSPNGKLPTQIGEWNKMSLPAMILKETVGEILQASRFAREIVMAVDTKPKKVSSLTDPKTPLTNYRQNSRLKPETTELNARRNREKRIIRSSDAHSPLLQRAKSRINFKVSGSPPKREIEKENCRFTANRVSPRNRPWAKKTVIFPNPLFHSSSPNQQNQSFCRTKSPVIPKTRPITPHKFLIKTPPAAARGKAAGVAAAATSSSAVKFQVKIKSPTFSLSGTTRKKSVSPPKKVSTAAKIRRSFSPSRLASKLASPLKSRRLSLQRTSNVSMDIGGGMMMKNMMSGLKQRPNNSNTIATPMPLSAKKS
ncbi:probable microtubule-binding protein TANGLED [Rutidosis leptorrhynchoides]|uniref:probable microtubule-binding protein TANGLED n=1 Tax=Rutidosis leptorrhynchoides TaxID=125765 RepID=UPI003A9993D3